MKRYVIAGLRVLEPAGTWVLQPLVELYLLHIQEKAVSKVLSSVQGSFPVLLIKLWDIETQAGGGNDWMDSITLFIYLLAYRYACLGLIDQQVKS